MPTGVAGPAAGRGNDECKCRLNRITLHLQFHQLLMATIGMCRIGPLVPKLQHHCTVTLTHHVTLCEGDWDNMFHPWWGRASPMPPRHTDPNYDTANAMIPIVRLGLATPSPRECHPVIPIRTQIPPVR